MSKNYERPALLVTTIQLGVFGQYGTPDRDEVLEFPHHDRHSAR